MINNGLSFTVRMSRQSSLLKTACQYDVHGVAVGVGDAATTLKLTVLEWPLVPVPPMELHGVATNVWVPIVAGVQVKSKGIAESVFTLLPSLLNTTLSVYGFVCAVTV